LRGYPHRPGPHAATGSAGARLADKRGEIGYAGVAQGRGNTKETLRSRELETFDGVTLVKPRFSDSISGFQKVVWEKEEFRGEGVDG
jgi:hypothetical protein